MKIYLLPNGITMVGKVWEIRAKLREYTKKYETIQQMLTSPKK